MPKPVLPVAVKERKYDRKEMKEFLYRLYVLEGKSLSEIGKEFGERLNGSEEGFTD